MINFKKENLARMTFIIDFLQRTPEYDDIDLSKNLTRTKAWPLFVIEILREVSNLTDDINLYYFRKKLKDKYRDRFSKRKDINREINNTLRLALKKLERMGILTLIKVQGEWKIKNIQQERIKLALDGLKQINAFLNSKFIKIESNQILNEFETPTKQVKIHINYDTQEFFLYLNRLNIPILEVPQYILIPDSWVLLITEKGISKNTHVWNIQKRDFYGGNGQLITRNQDILRNLAESKIYFPKNQIRVSYKHFKTSKNSIYVGSLLIQLIRQSDYDEYTKNRPIEAPALVIFTKKGIINPLKMLDNNLKRGKIYSDNEKPRGLYQVISNCLPIKTNELYGNISEFFSNPSLPLFVGIGLAPQSTILWDSFRSNFSDKPLFIKLKKIQRWADNDLLSLFCLPNTLIGPFKDFIYSIRPSERIKLEKNLHNLGVIENTIPTEIQEILEHDKGIIGKKYKYYNLLHFIREELSKIKRSVYIKKYEKLKHDIRVDETCYLTFFFRPEGENRCINLNLIEYKECVLHFNKNKKIRIENRNLIVQPFAKVARLLALCSIYRKKKSEFMEMLFPP